MFSKRQVQDGFQPVVWEKANKLCSKVAENGVDDNIVILSRGFSAFSADIITQFAFAKCYNHLESPGFEDTFHESYEATGASSHVMLQFPWMLPLMKSMPEWLVVKIQPLLALTLRMQQVCSANEL